MDQSEILKALKAANENVEKLAGANSELKSRVLDLEQRGHGRGIGIVGSDGTSLQRAFEENTQFKAMQKGDARSATIQIPSDALNQKAFISSTVSGGFVSQADRAALITAPNQRRLRMRELLPSLPTTQGSTEFLRETVFTNAALPQGGTASPTEFQGEGVAVNESGITLELATAPVILLGHYFTISRQAMNDNAELMYHIENRGVYGLNLEIDTEILTGTGASGKLNGLINNATAFTGGATNQTALDTIRKACTQLALADYVATGVVLSPRDAESLELAKDSQGRYLSTVMYGTDGVPIVWRIPIVESNAMNQGTFLVGDFERAAIVRDRQLATIELSLDHASYRIQNLCLVYASTRIGLEIHRSGAMIYGSLSYAG